MAASPYALPFHCLSIGDSILIYWDGDRKWYPAEITETRGDHECEVLYKDGEREWIKLDEVKFIIRRQRGDSVKRSKGDEGEEEEIFPIEKIKDILFDLEDRLPLGAVCTEALEWWQSWHDDVVMKKDIQGLMGATLHLALQVKPSVMTTWWSKNGESWKKRLKGAVTALDATVVVKDLRNNAINWSIARKLFSEEESGKTVNDYCSHIEPKNLDAVIGQRSVKPANLSGRRMNFRKPCSKLPKCSNLSAPAMVPSDAGEVQLVACRRSNRLKKNLPASKGKSCAKNSTGKPEPVVDWVVQSCSKEDEEPEHLISVCSLPSKRRCREQADRVVFNDCGSLDVGDAPKFNTAEPLNERSSGDSTTKHRYTGTDELLCFICQSGLGHTFLVHCSNSGCFCACHTFCFHPPLQTTEQVWHCPKCEGDSYGSMLAKGRKQIAKRIHRIVGRKQVTLKEQNNVLQDQFLIKWESLSHHHDSWVPREWLYIMDPRRLHAYMKKFFISSECNLVDERKPEWLIIDRVIACRRKCSSDKYTEILSICSASQNTGEFEFLVKWTGLDYCESTWESACTEELLAEVARLIKRHQRAAERLGTSSLPSRNRSEPKMPIELFGNNLYGYQLQGVNWLLTNFKARENVILADEMGLGKTVQVVSFIQCMKQGNLNADPILIIAPKSILFQWEKEFHNWAKDLNVIIYQGEKESRHCIQRHEIYSSGNTVLFDALITNYEIVILDTSILKKIKWAAIIIDEAHKIKRLDCKLAKYLKQYVSDFRLLLTGTPLQNTLLELFSLLHFIDPERFSDPEAEAESYSNIKNLSHLDTEKKIADIHELLKPRMLRRMKSDVLPGSIPTKKWIEVPCALTDSQRELYINILEKNYENLNKQIESGRKIILNFIFMELRKCCNHPYLLPGQEPHLPSKEAIFRSLVSSSGKLQLLEKLLPRLRERGNRVLLFSQMTKMLDILEDFLMALGLSYFRLDGSTPISVRQEQMKDFNSLDSPIFIFLISTRAGGLGIDLPTADRVIIYDPDFNPFMDLQAQSRAHRIGQTRPVVVYQLITKCSVEEKILQKSKEKLAIENLVMNPSKKPSVDELHSVLLHGARTILNKRKINATSISYDDKAIDDLLKLDPAPGENCSPDENGYLGSIQSFLSGVDDDGNEGPPPASPKAKDWGNILGPVRADGKDQNLGRGRRRKRAVNYQCDGGSDSDDIYSPESSESSDGSDSSEDEPESKTHLDD